MKTRSYALILSGTAAVAIIGGVGSALVSAASTTTTSSRPGIARYTIRQDRLNAEAEVLNTTPTQLQSQLKTQTLQQIIQAGGFTKASFQQKVVAQLHTDLQAQGYSQSQINKALAKHRKHHA